MAVDDNSPKTGEPQAPSGDDESSNVEMNNLPSSAEKMQVAITDLQQPQQRGGTGGGGGGGRRKQYRPMRLVCSLIDTFDPQSDDDTAAVPGPPSMTADYPDDAADYCVDSSSPPPSPREDCVTELVVRRRHHACELCSHVTANEADLSVHCRIAHGRKSTSSHDRRSHHGGSANRRRSIDPDYDAVEVIDGDGATAAGYNDDVTDEVEFPTRYHRLGSELKREVETTDSRLERIHADAVRKLKTMMNTNDQHHRSSAADFHQSADFDASVGYSYSSHHQQPQQNFRSRNQPVDISSSAENSYTAALDFTVQSRSSAGNGGTAYDSPAPSRQHQQHHALSLITTSSGPSMFSSELSSTAGSEQLHHQQAMTVVAASQQGQHHHHQQPLQHHQQHQQQQSHHRSSIYSSSTELPVSVGTMSGSSVSLPMPSSSISSASPAVQVDSEDYCDRCQKHFCNKYYLRKHRQDVHGIAPSTDASSTSAANLSSSASTLNAVQQQQHFGVGYPSVTAAVQQLFQQQSGGDSSSPGLSNSSTHASVLPYQQLINSLPFLLPYQQSMGLPGTGMTSAGSIMSSGSLMFPSPSTSISSMAGGGLQSNADSTTAGIGQAALTGGGLLPGLTSLMLLNPFAILNSPSFLAAAAGMNHLTASSSLNTLAELQKSGGGGLFPAGLDDGTLSMAGLLPQFIGSGPSDHQSSMLSPPSNGQQQPPQSGTSVEDFSASPSSTSSSTASFTCDLCRKEFCSSYYLSVHQRDKHGLTSTVAGDASSTIPSSTSASSSSQAAAAAAAMAAAAGLRLPSSALSDAIRLLAASNGRSSIDGALGLGMMGDGGVEPGEKINSSGTGRGTSGKLGSSNDKLTGLSSGSGGRGSGTGSNERLGSQQQLLTAAAAQSGMSSSNPEDVCCLCKKQFPNRYGLVLHLLSAHNIRPEGFGLAGELLQLDGLLSAGGISVSQHQSVTTSAGNVGSSGRSVSRSSTGNMGPMSGITSSSGGGSQTGNGGSSSKQSDRVSCDICNKEVCNKYFLKTHKIKVHGVDSSVAAYVPPPQQHEAAGRTETQNVTPPADSKSGRGGLQSSTASMKHEDMRKGLMLADSQLNSFAAHLDLALKKDSFGLAGLGLGGLGFGGPPGSSSDRDHQPMLPFPPPSMSASDLFRLFSAVGGMSGKLDDPFGLSAAFGLGPAMKSLGLPELTDQLAATMAAAAAAGGGGGNDGRSRAASSSLNDLNIPKHPSSSSSSIGGGLMTSSYHGSSSNHGGLKNKQSASAGAAGSGKHSKEHHHMKSGSSSINATSSSAAISSSQSSGNQHQSSMDRQPMSEQDLIQSGIDPEAYCELCQKEFCSKYFLRTHRQKIHGVAPGGAKSSLTGGASGTNESSTSAGGSTNALVAGAFDHYRNMASNSAAGLSSLAAGAAMPLLPLFQGLSLPPVPFCTAPPQLMLPPDATGLLSSADAIGGHSGLSTNMSTPSTRSTSSREAANATRVTCEVCGKELCNKYFLKTHMAKIHGSHPTSSSAQSSSSSSSTSSVARENSREHVQSLHSASGSSSAIIDAAAGYQRLDGSDNRMLTASDITPTKASMMGLKQATGNDVDLLAPSAFQSLVLASGSRGSPSTPTSGHQQMSIKSELGPYGTPSLYRNVDNDGDTIRRLDFSSSSATGQLQTPKQLHRGELADVKSSMSSRKYDTSPDSVGDITDNGLTSDPKDNKPVRRYGGTVNETGSTGDDDDDVCSDDEDNGDMQPGDVWRGKVNEPEHGERGTIRGVQTVKRKQLTDNDVGKVRKRSRTDVGEFSSSSSSSSSSPAENYRIVQHSVTSSSAGPSDSGENGLAMSGRDIGHSVEFLQHQLLLSKLASELHSRSLSEMMNASGAGERVQSSTKNITSDTEDDSKMPVSALLQRHIQQQQQQLLLQQQLHQFPSSYRGSPVGFDQLSGGDDAISPDVRSRRSRGSDDAALQRFLTTTNGHSSLSEGAGSSMFDRTSPSSAVVDNNGGSMTDVGSAAVSGGVTVSSPTCRLYLPPVIGRPGRDQVGIDFSLTGSGRTTTPQQAD